MVSEIFEMALDILSFIPSQTLPMESLRLIKAPINFLMRSKKKTLIFPQCLMIMRGIPIMGNTKRAKIFPTVVSKNPEMWPHISITKFEMGSQFFSDQVDGPSNESNGPNNPPHWSGHERGPKSFDDRNEGQDPSLYEWEESDQGGSK